MGHHLWMGDFPLPCLITFLVQNRWIWRCFFKTWQQGSGQIWRPTFVNPVYKWLPWPYAASCAPSWLRLPWSKASEEIRGGLGALDSGWFRCLKLKKNGCGLSSGSYGLYHGFISPVGRKFQRLGSSGGVSQYWKMRHFLNLSQGRFSGALLKFAMQGCFTLSMTHQGETVD